MRRLKKATCDKSNWTSTEDFSWKASLGQVMESEEVRSLTPEQWGRHHKLDYRATTQCNANQCNDKHNSRTEAVPLVLPCCTVQVEDLNLEANSMTMWICNVAPTGSCPKVGLLQQLQCTFYMSTMFCSRMATILPLTNLDQLLFITVWGFDMCQANQTWSVQKD